MLTLNESTRQNPAIFICNDCQKEILLTLHHDFLEGYCCSKEYQVKVGKGIWNCCFKGDNAFE